MIRRIITLSAAFLATVLMLGLTAGMASADVSGLKIGQIGYNAYGADTADNRNSEYIDVTNTAQLPVDVKGMLVQDAWAHGNNRTSRCNTYTVPAAGVPAAVAGGAGTDTLPAGATLRIHMGAGTPYVRDGIHHVFRNMDPRCGYHGHVLNNGPGANKRAPWDTVWISLRSETASKSYNFSYGYFAG